MNNLILKGKYNDRNFSVKGDVVVNDPNLKGKYNTSCGKIPKREL